MRSVRLTRLEKGFDPEQILPAESFERDNGRAFDFIFFTTAVPQGRRIFIRRRQPH